MFTLPLGPLRQRRFPHASEASAVTGVDAGGPAGTSKDSREHMSRARARAERGRFGEGPAPSHFLFGLTMAAMDAAVEIVFSPPVRPVQPIATAEVAFVCLSDIAVGKSQRSFYWLCLFLFSREAWLSAADRVGTKIGFARA